MRKTKIIIPAYIYIGKQQQQQLLLLLVPQAGLLVCDTYLRSVRPCVIKVGLISLETSDDTELARSGLSSHTNCVRGPMIGNVFPEQKSQVKAK